MTEKEIKTLRSIIKEYSDIDEKMHQNEELLKKISAEQTSLMKRLETNEAKEKKFMDSMNKNHLGLTLIDLLKYI